MAGSIASVARMLSGNHFGRSLNTRADDTLLTQFLADHDEEAFAELVRRHGPMVFAICHRLAGDVHIAEDAFQAVFVVLARRAKEVIPGSAVRGWLYGVAVRTAKEARSIAIRRRTREQPFANLPDRPSDTAESPGFDEVLALVEEIACLPQHLRTAVILYEIDGLSRRVAANQMGIPEGTLASRLGKARKLLAARLRHRGVTTLLVGLTVELESHASTGVPSTLVKSTIRISTHKGYPLSAMVAELTKGVGRPMLMKPMLALAASAITIASLISASEFNQDSTSLNQVEATGKVDEPTNKTTQGVKQTGPNRIFLTGEGGVISINPEGKDEKKLDVPESAKYWAVPSPDGLKIAYVVESPNNLAAPYLSIAEIGGRAQASRFRFSPKAGYLDFSWSPDGSLIHACTGMEGVKGVQHFRMEVKGMTLRPLDMLKTRTVDGWSPDGKSLVTTKVGAGDQWEPTSVHLVGLDGKEKQVLAAPKKGWVAHGQLSPDGKRLLVCREGGLAVVDVGSPETLIPVAGGPDEHIERGEYDWSPDGKRIVFRRQKGTLQEPGDEELVVAEPDGKNATVIRKSKDGGIWKVYWR